ncbi:MAG: hypothetical protein JW702_11860 [Clostridiales bacterium]|nr:hypothetical protein [Clostridiales bacterium]
MKINGKIIIVKNAMFLMTVLIATSFVQKISIKAPLFLIRGYIVPIIFGLIIGSFIGYYKYLLLLKNETLEIAVQERTHELEITNEELKMAVDTMLNDSLKANKEISENAELMDERLVAMKLSLEIMEHTVKHIKNQRNNLKNELIMGQDNTAKINRFFETIDTMSEIINANTAKTLRMLNQLGNTKKEN